MDYITADGVGVGSVAQILLKHGGDPAALRPYQSEVDGRSYVNLTANKNTPTLVANDATLRPREWIALDTAVVAAAKQRLKAWDDLALYNCTRQLPNAMATTVMQYQTQTDISPATTSMDGLRRSERDRPTMDLRSLPIPIIHKDFSISARELAVSRRDGAGIDATSAALMGRRVAEEAEKFLIGTNPSYQYGGGVIYGYKNFPDRITYTLRPPTGGTWTPAQTLQDVLGMKAASQARFHYGPWVLYCSTAWDFYLDSDFSSVKGDNTLRTRLKAVSGITDVRTLDYLTGWDLLLVQMQTDTVEGINGMDVTTIQWPGEGGMEIHMKVMAIKVPRLMSDHNNNCGIVHAA